MAKDTHRPEMEDVHHSQRHDEARQRSLLQKSVSLIMANVFLQTKVLPNQVIYSDPEVII